MRPIHLLASFAVAAVSAGAAFGQALEPTNLGPMRENIFTGHVLTPPPAPGEKGPLDRILYCPSEADDPVLRADISAAAGGATVDYFDARAATPSLPLLLSYDAAYTWVNFAYFDKVAMGDALAQASDGGVNIVLGVFCTYTTFNYLDGAIRGPAYSPVTSLTGGNHFLTDFWAGDGTTCIYDLVSYLECSYRDELVIHGSGVVDGTYTDGEIAHAYRPFAGPGKGSIVYQNGAGAVQLSPSPPPGDWPRALANAALCRPDLPLGSCTFRDGVLGLNPKGYFCVNVPVSGAVWNASVDLKPTTGITTLQSFVALGLSGPIDNWPILGHELLILPPFYLDPGYGAHSSMIPPGLTGGQLYTQGARLEMDKFGVLHIVLLNAQDLVIG